VTVVAIIPARLGSTRLPGKVLLDQTGKPLIQHVYESARRASVLSRVVVATDDQRVAGVVRTFGGEAVLTRADHPNGTSRLAEAASALGLAPADVIVNVQGDEPEVEPGAIAAAVDALHASGFPMATVAVPFAPGEDPGDPNCVKVVVGAGGRALYFSRSLIPFDRDKRGGPDAAPLRHVGLYVYRRSFLDEFLSLPPAPSERAEQLEQLRALHHGHAIAVALQPHARTGIDTPAQYDAFVQRWEGGRSGGRNAEGSESAERCRGDAE
jgi:3-deoxy-manno-octulosonate cytidylyltransferase (CMP-KDO synthetase)